MGPTTADGIPPGAASGDRHEGRVSGPPSAGQRSHVVQLCSDEDTYARVVARFLGDGLAAGHPALVIATEAHRAAILAGLEAAGLRPQQARASGRLELLDAETTLLACSGDAGVDRERFFAVVGRTLRSCAAAGEREPVVHGEMVDLLCGVGDMAGAVRLESLWNELALRDRFHLLCTYSTATFASADTSAAYDEICGHHSHVLPSPRQCEADDAHRLRELARLEQRALALEAELRHRRQLERQLREALEERERARAEVLDRERDLTDCLENAAQPIHWVGPDGRVLWANRAELELLGYRAEEYVGRPVSDFHADAHVIDDILRRLRRGEALRDYEARLRHRDGSIRTVRINSNVLWRDGQFVHTRCFTRDVTELQNAAEERERLLARERDAREAAEAANRAKGEFLAVMSHELRTPLNAIGGYVDLLELGLRGPLTEEQRTDLTRIRRSQRHLLGLINEVLNYSCIESRAVRYEIEEVDVAEIVAAADPLVRPQMDAAGLRFVVEPCPRGAVARADREKAQQVLLNLLGNAAKFTDRGGEVRVRCELAMTQAGTPAVRIGVIDTGRGISPAKLEVIFEPFVQVDTGLTRAHQGAGLGLAISRDLAQGMGGELTVTSEPGVGSTFGLVLPRP